MIVLCNYVDCIYNIEGWCANSVIKIGGVNYAYRNAPCSQFKLGEKIIKDEQNYYEN